ncbi:transcriptional regulator [Labrenzia sp. PHM005]|uniref:transcriptional regulator n=1 Tax=Labrenzia sp. PHM005 TaxID=2590016 RepID=UPI00114022DE|nr:transcriptional regulator [Labrenzia sp. PHM005]QDG74431.1 transcriptional regulator [Labrenzia sp. PHM005]
MTAETMAAKAKIAWGADLPDYVRELARLADNQSLNSCAKRIGLSPATLSQTISNRYPGNQKKVEAAVRGALMGETVVCPILGEIGRHICLDWQGKPRAVTNAIRSQVYRACRDGCPHSYLRRTSNA